VVPGPVAQGAGDFKLAVNKIGLERYREAISFQQPFRLSEDILETGVSASHLVANLYRALLFNGGHGILQVAHIGVEGHFCLFGHDPLLHIQQALHLADIDILIRCCPRYDGQHVVGLVDWLNLH